ncbi:MAG TPA: aminotransferase class IV [Conexibacter sp.]|jgi:branched-chain amino acid aminotransferase|nr:aminotransferase class IV [Conexibacter sp.]
MATAHLACLDGAVMPAADAVVPATDEGLLRGDGAFEVLRLYGGRPFALGEHLQRLERSAQNLRLPVDLAAVRADAARLLAAAAGAPDPGCLRIVLTRGGRRLLLTESLPEHAPAIRLATVTYAPVRLLDGVKSLSYAANMLATRLAQEQDADEALLVTPHGRVLEAPTSSIFWIADGAVRTPPLSDHILASITRAIAIELADAEERSCTREELLAADEAFLVSTTRELQPVATIDGQAIGAGGDAGFAGGPITRDLAGRLHARILAELDR